MKYLERFYPICLSLLFIVFIFLFRDSAFIISVSKKLFTENILSLVITIESILFGFLMTVISLIIQMNNKAIDAIKQLGRYKDLLNFARFSIYSSILVIFFSLFYILTEQSIGSIIYYVWFLFFIYSALSLYRFIHIFFVVAKST